MAEKGDMNHHKALQEDVASVYERATSTLLKENILLHFSYADFEEVGKSNHIYFYLNHS